MSIAKKILLDHQITLTAKPKKKEVVQVKDNVNAYGGLNSGGLYNSYSGIGGGNDKSRQSYFLPTLLDNRTDFEVLRNESWAAKRFIDLPVNQMLIRPREIENLNQKEMRYYEKYFDYYGLNTKIANALKAARLYGTAYLVFLTKDNAWDEPLDFDSLQPGDLYNVLVFDRFSVSVTEREYDVRSRNYQRPYIYHITPKWGGAFQIHHTRLLRFDGQMPLSSDGWTVYNIDYGVSEIIPVLQSIYQDAQAANGVSQLIEEASIPVVKVEGFKDVLGGGAPDAPSLDELASTFAQTKSIYNTIHMDTQDEFSRQEVNFSELPDILDRFASRLAAAAEIPATIFLGKSPLGMNATGESDLAINAAKVKADQENRLRPVYEYVDQIMMRTSRLSPRCLDYSFPSILDLSDESRADVLLKISQAVTPLVQEGTISPDEARRELSGDDRLGELPAQGFDFNQQFQQQQAEQNAPTTEDAIKEVKKLFHGG
jgi:phage-related protein (TIGR01555 family)